MSHSAGRYQWSVSTHMLPGSIGVMTQAPLKVGGMYAVSPKKDCPHLTPEYLETDLAAYSAVTMTSPCTSCDNRGENWCCLKCASVLCSRFVKGHMLAHYEEVHHALAISFSDLSFWCYLCDSYVESPQLSTLLRHFQTVKFGEDIEQVVSSLQSLKVEEAKEEEKKEEPASKPTAAPMPRPPETGEQPVSGKSLEEICEQIKVGTFKRITFMAGANEVYSLILYQV